MLHINVDRTKAEPARATPSAKSAGLLVSLSGSFQTSPTFWLNPKNGVSYSIATETPQYRLDQPAGSENIPISGPSTSAGDCGDRGVDQRGAERAVVATTTSSRSSTSLVRYRRDLGSVADEIDRIVADSRKATPRPSFVTRAGGDHARSYQGLLAGLAFAIVFVYLLIVVNFQSWLDPSSLSQRCRRRWPASYWLFFISRTTFSVPR